MVEGGKQIESDIDRYLFVEMADEERYAFEERMFAEDSLFIEVADAENRLVDEYVAGSLSNDLATRFERSLVYVPARREKIANARALGEFIGENRPAVALPESQPSFMEKIAGLFAIRTPAFGMAMSAAVILLLLATGVLLVRDRQKRSDLARLNDLQSQLEQSRQREQELQSAVNSERESSGDFVDELDHERSRRQQIERELEQIKQKPVGAPETPVIATAFLMPMGGRGGSNTMPTVKIGPNTKRVALRLALPDGIDSEDRLSVRLNGKPIASDIAPRISAKNKSINVAMAATSLVKGRNDLAVSDAEGRAVSEYAFGVEK